MESEPTAVEPTEEILRRIAERLKAMGNTVRLRILHALEDGELTVGEIQARVGGSQANASKHLANLRNVGLVASRREGVNVYYRVSDEMVFTICQAVCDSLLDRANAEVTAIEQTREHLLPSRS